MEWEQDSNLQKQQGYIELLIQLLVMPSLFFEYSQSFKINPVYSCSCSSIKMYLVLIKVLHRDIVEIYLLTQYLLLTQQSCIFVIYSRGLFTQQIELKKDSHRSGQTSEEATWLCRTSDPYCIMSCHLCVLNIPDHSRSILFI